MKSLNQLKDFSDIYNKTYNSVLKFIVLHCNNFEDVNDLMQDTYLELYKHFKKKKLNDVKDISSYAVGISKNIVYKFYRKKYASPPIYDNEYNEELSSNVDIDIELQFITKENVEEVWSYIQNKNVLVTKIFYCYYYLDMKINEIAKEMNLNESTVKNHIYRTIKELKQKLKEECDENV